MAGRFLVVCLVPCVLQRCACRLQSVLCLFVRKPLLGCQNGRNVVALNAWRPTSQLCRVLWETIVGTFLAPVSAGPSVMCLIFPGPGTLKEGRGITAEAGGGAATLASG
jgi:hypothetical protein